MAPLLVAFASMLLLACEGDDGLAPDESEPFAPMEPSMSTDGGSGSTLTTEQLFKGVVFGYGEGADSVPVVKNNYRLEDFISDPELYDEVTSTLDQIYAEIEASDAAYLEDFTSKIRSGDHQQIEEALAGATQPIVDAVETMGWVDEYRQALDQDPALLQQTQDSVAAKLNRSSALDQLSDSDRQEMRQAIEDGVASFLHYDQVQDPHFDPNAVSIFIGPVFAVAAHFWVAVSQDVAVALNAALAVNVKVAGFVDTALWGPDSFQHSDGQLLTEDLIDSIAENLAIDTDIGDGDWNDCDGQQIYC